MSVSESLTSMLVHSDMQAPALEKNILCMYMYMYEGKEKYKVAEERF